MKNTRTSFALPAALVTDLTREAFALGLSRSAYLRMILAHRPPIEEFQACYRAQLAPNTETPNREQGPG